MNLSIQGVTDEQTTCDMCGRVELRRTCIVVDTDAGVEVGRYGTSCVSRLLGRKVTGSQVDSIELNRRFTLSEAKRAFILGMRALNGHRVALAREDIARNWIKGDEALEALYRGLIETAKSGQ